MIAWILISTYSMIPERPAAPAQDPLRLLVRARLRPVRQVLLEPVLPRQRKKLRKDVQRTVVPQPVRVIYKDVDDSEFDGEDREEYVRP